INEQDAGVAVIQGVGDLTGAPADIDRIHHATPPEHPVQVFHVVVGIAGQHGNPVAGLHAEALQATGQPRHPAGQLAPALATVAVNGGQGVGAFPECFVEGLGDVHVCLLLIVVVRMTGLLPYIRSGRKVTISGKATRMAMVTMSMTMNQDTPLKISPRRTLSLTTALRMKQSIPTGGEIRPISRYMIMMMPNQIRSYSRPVTMGMTIGRVSSMMSMEP